MKDRRKQRANQLRRGSPLERFEPTTAIEFADDPSEFGCHLTIAINLAIPITKRMTARRSPPISFHHARRLVMVLPMTVHSE